MGSYKIKSYIGQIADGIEDLITKGVMDQNRKVLLYGLERYGFAMRTILSNLGYQRIEGYISDDRAAVIQYRRDTENFASRFLNGRDDVIQSWTMQERLQPFDDSVLILIASRQADAVRAALVQMGYLEKEHFHVVTDFADPEEEAYLRGKVQMSLPEIKLTAKHILAYVDDFCRKHGLRYWVCSGTLLGTIRHKGFIPWDDDVDIFLPWKDYQRFMELFEETEELGLVGFGTERHNDYPDPLAKVVDKSTIVLEDIGTVQKKNPMWIDLFPLIGLPDDPQERTLFYAEYKELNRQIWQAFYAGNGDIGVFDDWFEKQKAYMSKYDFDQASCVGVLGTIYEDRDCAPRAVYEETLRMPFEDLTVNVPGGYREYLENLYGSDWMELPEESKRKSHHNFKAYWVEEPLISIIVPVYNAEAYLAECIGSICAQTYQNLDIILVDDGSTDRSPEICRRYQSRDSRIRIISKENGGHTSARKAGLQMAAGKYIGFVDADDWMEPDMVECLYQRISVSGADVAMCGRFEDMGESRKEVCHGIEEGYYDKEQLLEKVYPRMIVNGSFFEWGIFSSLWDKLFRRECVEPFLMETDERIVMGEDAVCVYPCLLSADSIYVIHRCLYHYRQTGASLIKSEGEPEAERRHFRLLYESGNRALEKKAEIYELREQWRAFILFLMTPRAGTLYEGIDGLDYLFPFPGVKRGERVIIYAMGTYGQHLYRYLERTGYCQIVAVADRNWEEVKKLGFPAIDPSDIPNHEYDAVVVASSFANVTRLIYNDLVRICPRDKVHLPDESLIKDELTLKAFGLV